VKLHTKKLKTPKMTRRKLQTLEFQTCAKVKKPSKFTRRKANVPLSPLVKLHTKKIEDPQNDKNKFDIF
jgi:hypothetical protein